MIEQTRGDRTRKGVKNGGVALNYGEFSIRYFQIYCRLAEPGSFQRVWSFSHRVWVVDWKSIFNSIRITPSTKLRIWYSFSLSSYLFLFFLFFCRCSSLSYIFFASFRQLIAANQLYGCIIISKFIFVVCGCCFSSIYCFDTLCKPFLLLLL